MQLFKFFLGIILVQLITGVLIAISPAELNTVGILRLIIPLLFVSLVVAFWFTSLAANYRKDSEAKIKSSFAKEKETIKVNAEKAKIKVVKEAQQDIAREAKMTYAKANFKVGAAFAGTLGLGALFVFAQMMTVGLLTLAAAGGAAGGYVYRGKRIENKRMEELPLIDVKVIER
ncbi:MAG: hypothetical protein KAG56_05290 [Sulfurovaceae bacterium]|nr:hypothetical protein [Sulfurovaceae bacterium]